MPRFDPSSTLAAVHQRLTYNILTSPESKGTRLDNEWQPYEYDLKIILLAVLVFVPLERLLPMHPGQKIFRPAWKNDLIYLFFNRLLIKPGLGIFSAGTIIVAEKLMPRSVQAAVGAQPLLFQVIEVIFWRTWASTPLIAYSTPSHGCGNFTKFITASGSSTGLPGTESTHWTKF